MAQRAERRDWTDQANIRERAKASARAFLSPVPREKGEERPLNPDLVTQVTELSESAPKGREKGAKDIDFGEIENHEDRITRPLERGRINEAPNTTYPG